MPQCADTSFKTAMKDMIEMQLGLMNLDRFNIYWIHNVWDAPKWTEELAKYFEGKDNVPMLGVSNHNLAEIRQADEIMKSRGLKLSGKYDTAYPMPEGSARTETYNPVMDKLEILNAELKRLADSLGINAIRF